MDYAREIDELWVSIRTLTSNLEVAHDIIAEQEAHSNSLHIQHADRMTKLERRIADLQEKPAKPLPHWTDMPR